MFFNDLFVVGLDMVRYFTMFMGFMWLQLVLIAIDCTGFDEPNEKACVLLLCLTSEVIFQFNIYN